MLFKREQDMTPVARRWLESRAPHMHIRQEFQTYWGICDLVGVSFNRNSVRIRLKNRQRKPLGSRLRVAVFEQLDDDQAVPVSELAERLGSGIGRTELDQTLARLLADRFVEAGESGTAFRRINGWIPLHKKLIAIELKLSRLSEVLHQAAANRDFADESYVGLPMDFARRVALSSHRLDFKDAGVGLVGVVPEGCRCLIRAAPSQAVDTVTQLHSVERFWRQEIRGSST